MNNLMKNWNFRRILYLIGGLGMIATAIGDNTWWLAIFGLYFMAMAIFQFGCASGNCSINEKEQPKHQQ